jgi:hypothetical protein
MLVEKRLGPGETIMLRNNSLFAFEKTVFFHNEIGEKFKRDYFIAEGPGKLFFISGLVIFELTNNLSKKQQAAKNARMMIILSTLISLLCIIPYMLQEFYNLNE